MGGQDQRRPAGQDAQLHARGDHAGDVQQLLHDRAALGDLGRERRPRLLLGAEHHRRVQQRAVEAGQVDHGVALAGEAVVELDDDRPDRRAGRRRSRRAAASTASTERRSSAPSSTATPASRATRREPVLEPRPARTAGGPYRGRPSRSDSSCSLGVTLKGCTNAPPGPSHSSRTRSSSSGRSSSLAVSDRGPGRRRPACAAATAPRRVGQEAEVVVDHRLLDRHRGQVDDLDPRPAQQQQQEQQPFLVVADADDLAQLGRGEAQAGEHHHRALPEVERVARRVPGGEGALQLLEGNQRGADHIAKDNQSWMVRASPEFSESSFSASSGTAAGRRRDRHHGA